jgi:chemotaxis response regulator CheB
MTGVKAWSVLVVDDDSAYRTVLATLVHTDPRLHLLGLAGDGLTALELARQHCPDVVVLDVQMPVMNGLTALPRLRQACPHSVIAIYSSDPESAGAALRHGADLVTDKAENAARLLDQIVERCSRAGNNGS